MRTRILEKKNISALLKELTKDWDVYAPQKNLGKDVWFDALPRKPKELEEALENIKEAIEAYLESVTKEEVTSVSHFIGLQKVEVAISGKT